MEDNLKAKGDALLKEIEDAFGDVRRDGGVSWSQTSVLDGYGTPQQLEAALRLDTEAHWQSLVDDPLWRSDMGVGGWSFLDAIGFRYYLPAAMVRCIRSGQDEGIAFHLKLSEAMEDHNRIDLRAYTLDQWSALDHSQRRCVKHFVEYMSAIEEGWLRSDFEKISSLWGQNITFEEWRSVQCVGSWHEILESFWNTVSEDTPAILKPTSEK